MPALWLRQAAARRCAAGAVRRYAAEAAADGGAAPVRPERPARRGTTAATGTTTEQIMPGEMIWNGVHLVYLIFSLFPGLFNMTSLSRLMTADC